MFHYETQTDRYGRKTQKKVLDGYEYVYTINGSLVCRNEGIIFQNHLYLNWDSRLFSGSPESVANSLVGMPVSAALPQILDLQEVLSERRRPCRPCPSPRLLHPETSRSQIPRLSRRLLNEDCLLLVMSGLPDAHGRAVRLHLVDIPSLNPDVLRLLDRLLHDHGLLLNHDRLLDDRRSRYDGRSGLNNYGVGVIRTHQSRPHDATDHPANEARPEVPAAASPVTAMAVVVMVAAMPAVVNRRRMVEAAVMGASVPATSECASRNGHEGECYDEFLHLIIPFFISAKMTRAKTYRNISSRLLSARDRTDQTADQAADKSSNESAATSMMLDVVNDMMSRRRRRRAMMMHRRRTAMTSIMGSGNRRTGRENQARNENHNCFDDLVHITPTFPGFCPYTRLGEDFL